MHMVMFMHGGCSPHYPPKQPNFLLWWKLVRFHVSIQCSLLAVLEDQVEILFVNTQGRIDLHEVLVFDLTHEGLSEGVLGLVADDVGFELFGSDVYVV